MASSTAARPPVEQAVETHASFGRIHGPVLGLSFDELAQSHDGARELGQSFRRNRGDGCELEKLVLQFIEQRGSRRQIGRRQRVERALKLFERLIEAR